MIELLPMTDHSAPENVDRLVAAWPRLFRGRVPFRSQLPPGWYAIADELCHRIDAALTDDELACVSIEQIKEKFGVLRIGVIGSWEPSSAARGSEIVAHVKALVNEASDLSSRTCMRCGQPGARRSFGGLVATVCPAHEVEMGCGVPIEPPDTQT